MKNEMSSYFEDPEFKESLAKYEGMVENHTPAYFDADELNDIAQYYASKGRHEDADNVIDFALQLHPNNTDALIFRARALAIKGKLDEANKIAGLIEDCSDREVKFLKADLLMDQGLMAEADAILQQLAASEGNGLRTLLDIIQDFIDINEEEYAKKWFDIIAENYDLTTLPQKNQHVRNMLCDYYTTFYQPELAIPLLRMTLDEYPYSIEHWNELGKCQIQLGEYEAAHEALDFASAIDDKNLDTIALKAFCFRQSGNLTEACKYYLYLSQISGDIIRPYLTLAKIYLDMNDYESAIYYIEILLTEKSGLTKYELAEVYCDAAICHAAFRESVKGYECISLAISLNENDPEIRIAAGRFFLMIAQTTENEKTKKEFLENATKEFEQALQLAPEDERFDNLLNIATNCFDAHDYNYASRYLETINKDFPKEARLTYFFLIYCYFYLQKLPSFMHYLAKIKKEIPKMYDGFGVIENPLNDARFNELLREMKDNINSGKIDINKYL